MWTNLLEALYQLLLVHAFDVERVKKLFEIVFLVDEEPSAFCWIWLTLILRLLSARILLLLLLISHLLVFLVLLLLHRLLLAAADWR